MKNEKLIEKLEDIHDSLIADLAYEEHLKNPRMINIKEVAKKYGIINNEEKDDKT
ncbi:hypothetical protein ACWOEY_11375 [Enterococcus sulfureus]